MGYTKEQLSFCVGACVPDLIGADCKLLFVGINPGLQTAMTGLHFAHPSNRFWPAMKKAGNVDWVPDVSPTTPAVRVDVFDPPTHVPYPVFRPKGLDHWDVDISCGMTEAERQDFIARGMGITNLVSRASVRASDLTSEELSLGGTRLVRFVDEVRPAIVAVAGVTAYRSAFSDPKATMGRQARLFGESAVWVVPNPSGLNAHETVASLANWYREVATEAGLK